jgi:tetratricopeptide (TPR) repeat protein
MFCWRFGIAQYTAGYYETAITCMKEIVSPINDVRGWLAASYAQAGRLDEARATMEEFLRLAEADTEVFPGRSLAAWKEHWAKFFPYRHAADFERVLEGLRKAGLE